MTPLLPYKRSLMCRLKHAAASRSTTKISRGLHIHPPLPPESARVPARRQISAKSAKSEILGVALIE